LSVADRTTCKNASTHESNQTAEQAGLLRRFVLKTCTGVADETRGEPLPLLVSLVFLETGNLKLETAIPVSKPSNPSRCSA
jgi:hypothetical protein